jgi:hypothetical protein
MKYGIIGLLMLAGAGLVLWLMLGKSDQSQQKTASAQVDAGTGTVERETSLAQPEFEIPDEEQDSGVEDSGQQETEEQPQRRRRRRRGRWDCSGEIPAAEALKVINQHRRQVRSCYERQLKVNNTLQGKINLQLRIGRGGDVAGVRTGGTLRDQKVLRCVHQKARRWKFPAPEGGRCAVVAAPFNLTPRR